MLKFILLLAAAILVCGSNTASAQVLDKQKLLDAQTFWDNRDWDWYKESIPFFECPDAQINTTYYYRWELVTKHLTYGSPNSGYALTEFIDRPFWSGTYGAISCPAGHQLYELRWLRDDRVAQDYGRYWFRTPGAQPRRYSTWLADATWAAHLAHPDEEHIKALLPDLVDNYQQWEKTHFVDDVGLFWQTGHDDGMEININSRQTADTVRGAPGYRPTLNSYLWADAMAISRIAALAGDRKIVDAYAVKAAKIKEHVQQKLWDRDRGFFFHMYMQNEEAGGATIKALSLTEQTGRYAGSGRGREEIGYVPWQFNLPDAGYESAWKYLMDREFFYADFGPTTTERHDPMFLISGTCCVWSGQSWPYATTQTLKAMANLLQNYQQQFVTKADYLRLLQIYTNTHRKDGRPYIAEAAHPDNGSWDGHDSYNHSEHYFHSGYVDLIVTGLVGLRPRADDTIEVFPLAPDDWDYMALDDLVYHGLRVSIVWDRKGDRYGLGKGLHILVDGKSIASSERLEHLSAKLPPASTRPTKQPTRVNYAVNNDGQYYPKISVSYFGPKASPAKIIDGNYWYHISPPNRWTCEGSPNESDWCAVDFGVKRPIDTVKLYLLDDGEKVTTPARFELEAWDGQAWAAVPGQVRTPATPTGHRANVIQFAPLEADRLRAVFTHAAGGRAGLTEFEAWGPAMLPVKAAPPPTGNLAARVAGQDFPKVAASFTSQHDRIEMVNDNVISFNANPHNRWTSYESPNASDWLEIDFGQPQTVGRVELAIYDDGGGVRAPASYDVQLWDGKSWESAAKQQKIPEQPAGSLVNEVRFGPVKAAKLRVVFVHQDKARSGLSEIFVWPQ